MGRLCRLCINLGLVSISPEVTNAEMYISRRLLVTQVGAGLLVLTLLVGIALLANRPRTQPGVAVNTRQPVQQIVSDTDLDPTGAAANAEASDPASESHSTPAPASQDPSSATDNPDTLTAAPAMPQGEAQANPDNTATPTSLSRVSRSITLEDKPTKTPAD